MPAYLINDIEITDPVRYEEYKRLADAAMPKYGGRFLVRGGNPQSLEGDWSPKRVVVIEFKDAAAARRWFESPEYAKARQARKGAAKFRAIVAEGVALPQ